MKGWYIVASHFGTLLEQLLTLTPGKHYCTSAVRHSDSLIRTHTLKLLVFGGSKGKCYPRVFRTVHMVWELFFLVLAEPNSAHFIPLTAGAVSALFGMCFKT